MLLMLASRRSLTILANPPGPSLFSRKPRTGGAECRGLRGAEYRGASQGRVCVGGGRQIPQPALLQRLAGTGWRPLIIIIIIIIIDNNIIMMVFPPRFLNPLFGTPLRPQQTLFQWESVWVVVVKFQPRLL
jgi:hypothetical protein